MRKLFTLLFLAILAAGCDTLTGKEIGRLKINHVSTENHLVMKEVTLNLKKGTELAIWSDWILHTKAMPNYDSESRY